MRSQARVVIVGGGVMGAGLLYHLAEEGWTDIVLVEKGELTSGSTWHAAGQCPSFTGSYNLAKIHHHGNMLYPKLEEKTGVYVSWHGCGGVRLATSERDLQWFRHVDSFKKQVGFDMEIIPPEEIKKHHPFVETDGVLAAALTTMDGHVDPSGVTNAMAAGARQMGAEVVRHNRVTNIQALPSGEWKVETEQGDIICEHVVNSAGCYAREVARWAGVDVPIANVLHHYVVTEPIKEFLERDEEVPVIRDPYCSAYYRQEQKSGLIGIYETAGAVTGWDDGLPLWESENELFEPDYDRIATWLERVMGRMPIWAESGIRRTVHGAIPHTPDANPLLGPAPGLKNYWMCNGSSVGIAQGAGCGKYLAQWMVHGESEINMREFDPRRFDPKIDDAYMKEWGVEDYQNMYQMFQPGTELDIQRNRRLTPLHEKLKAKGAVFTAAYGWERPKWFSPDGRIEDPSFNRNNVFEVVEAECRAVTERVGVLDLSSFAKYDVTGADAEAFLNRLSANRMPKRQGGLGLCHFLTENGCIETEMTVTRLADNKFYVLSGAAMELHDLDLMQQGLREGEDVTIANVTDDYGMLALMGPKARDVLAQVTDADLSNEAFRWLTAREIKCKGAGGASGAGGDINVRALRVSYVGELGWELHCPMAHLEALYDALWAAGEAHGIADFGVYAVNSMRLEKAYKGMGAELTNEITPVEADIERFVRLDKDDFTGKAAVLRRKQQGAAIKCVYCRVDAGNTDVIGGEGVFDKNGAPAGVTTSGGYGHRTGQSLCFAYVDTAFAEPGAEVQIQLQGEMRKAVILDGPVYDAENARLKA
ncbi:MAG: FAD-dependent oxidoreductase [Rhodospirillales bacterium]